MNFKFLIRKLKNFWISRITDAKEGQEISEKREIEASNNREMERPRAEVAPDIENESQEGPSSTSGNAGTGHPSAEVAAGVRGASQKGPRSTSDNFGSGTVTSKIIITCPYCGSEDFVKRGTRKKKRETVQLYLCRSCRRTFTPFSTKGKHYPLNLILEALSYYNLGFSLEQTCKIMAQKGQGDQQLNGEQSRQRNGNSTSGNVGTGHPRAEVASIVESESQKGQSSTSGNVGIGTLGTGMIQPSTLNNWVREFSPLCAYTRMRPFGMKMYSPYEIIETATLAHRQLYRYRFHRAKIKLIIEEDFKHYRFGPLREFLELVPAETPHQYFQRPRAEVESGVKGQSLGNQILRASKAPLRFSKTEMIVRNKQNYATRLAKFVLQGVKENKQRHEALQRFMLANDSVTVATEIPVYIKREDLEHMKTQLGFETYIKDGKDSMREAKLEELPKLITGHIDFLQIRNGMIHILDYKPRAAKEKPIEQLTLYALALSRLTGLRLYCFKCAWFDEKDYFEFFPLHVVYKKKKGRRKNIRTKEGVYKINQNFQKIENIRPNAEVASDVET